jgi:hypothetical protein
MTSYSPSYPLVDDSSLHDIEIENIPYNHEFAVNSNLVVEINDNSQINCNIRVIFHRILYLLLLSSLIFIIYEHHDTIGLYLSDIAKLF